MAYQLGTEIMERHNFAAGELIFAKEDDASHLFMVLSGEVEVRQGDFIAVVSSGQIFGEAALLTKTRSMPATAKSDCVLLSMTRDEIIESFTEEPDLAIQIIDALFKKLANTTDELIRLKASNNQPSVAD